MIQGVTWNRFGVGKDSCNLRLVGGLIKNRPQMLLVDTSTSLCLAA